MRYGPEKTTAEKVETCTCILELRGFYAQCKSDGRLTADVLAAIYAHKERLET